MKRSIVSLILVAVVALAACARDEGATAGGEETATIGRPEPQPGELGTDALSQTVELEDGRSEAEGGVVTNPDPKVRVGSPIPPDTATQTNPPPPPRQP
ncbi:MAG TPA: hypothetical protein VNA04_12775 [Thermoanaerobaculia bacterium]|nr:hypothetical protein [Thermoanaerobaculia bacterium]